MQVHTFPSKITIRYDGVDEDSSGDPVYTYDLVVEPMAGQTTTTGILVPCDSSKEDIAEIIADCLKEHMVT
jgi:hypothetical protein